MIYDSRKNDNARSLSYDTFNCKGYKQSVDYIGDRLQKGDILCLCETWLKSHELDMISNTVNNWTKLRGHSYSCFANTGMVDLDPECKGQPFGGVDIICKNQMDLSFLELETSNEHSLLLPFL